ncbi:LPS export ABC transporter periplasmic protein LptC [Campylobacter sp. FMV-PI01]|uniref:LPS export ABC transporter periplasmic protein LptC n=2 Tax=Campylobacter portucalensis TaxID=2608384 RepID=A0A6L5WGS0_9BACT|nr:LPS export ABC transporter periplasmic protein LptC [Campylobacter portucalensis]
MAIRIFYIAISIFSVAMVFLSLQTPYFRDFFKSNLEIASMEMIDIVDYGITPDIVNSKYTAKKGVKFKDRDEFYDFRGQILGDFNHTLSSKKALYKNNTITLFDDVKYSNSDGLNYLSDEIIYNTKTKIVKSQNQFLMLKGENNITGKNLVYDLNKKQSFAKEVKAWYHIK